MVHGASAQFVGARFGRSDELLEISESFEVRGDPDEVWSVLSDVERVVACFRGATLGGTIGDGLYEGSLAMAFGPITATFDGQVEATFDDTTRTCTLTGRGVDRRGRNRAKADAEIHQLAEPGGDQTSLSVRAQIDVNGPLAQFAQTGGAQLARAMLADFAECLSSQVSGPPGGPESGEEQQPLRPLQVLMAAIRDYLGRLRGRLSRSDKQDPTP